MLEPVKREPVVAEEVTTVQNALVKVYPSGVVKLVDESGKVLGQPKKARKPRQKGHKKPPKALKEPQKGLKKPQKALEKPQKTLKKTQKAHMKPKKTPKEPQKVREDSQKALDGDSKHGTPETLSKAKRKAPVKDTTEKSKGKKKKVS